MRKIVNLVYVLTVLILIDLTATLYWVLNDLAHEANPIMDFFLQYSPLLFVIAKLGLSGVGIWILYYFRKRFKNTIFKQWNSNSLNKLSFFQMSFSIANKKIIKI